MVGSLPKYYDKRYFDARVILPKYMCISDNMKSLMQYRTHFYMDFMGQSEYVGVLEAQYDGITYYFIDNEKMFGGFKPYSDDHIGEITKFVFFSKAALSILSASTPANLALSIITGDEKALTAAQGVGKKIAQRVILELKDKLAKGQSISAAGENISGPAVTVIPQNKLSEASAALAVLGYSQGEINTALKGIDIDAQPLEQIIRLALKNMVKP